MIAQHPGLLEPSPVLPKPACRQPFPYSRCSAAAALAGLCKCEAGREEARAGGGVALLKALVLQEDEPQDAPAEQGELRGKPLSCCSVGCD